MLVRYRPMATISHMINLNTVAYLSIPAWFFWILVVMAILLILVILDKLS